MNIARQVALGCTVAVLAVPGIATARTDDAALAAWVQNLTNLHGQSGSTTINATLSLIPADVQQVRYSATDAYINATVVPHYSIGPWPSNPNVPSNQNLLARFPKAPVVNTGTKTATGLGAIGLMVDGTEIFNASDAHTYQNRGFWNQNAVVVEGPSFDAALGHPAPGGAYHYHGQPRSLRATLGDDGSHHSPIVGFAYDGFPIYGPYGYTNANGTGTITRMTNSYRLRTMTTRTTLPNGTVLAAANYGPAVSASFPLGYYLEDYEYIAGLGTLDTYNGRTCVTPEYPGGTYAYFVTIDAAGNSAYPYLIGPKYNGVVATDNLNHSVTVPGTAQRYFPCAADYNLDGGVDGADIQAFFTDWANATTRSDVNQDGGVDGSDVVSFFDVWSNGGC